MKKRKVLTHIAALHISFCLMLTSVGLAPARWVSVNADTRAQYEERARQFDSALRELESVTSLNLTTERGASQANDILKRNLPYLSYGSAKGISVGLQARAFLDGIRAESSRRGATTFLKSISADPNLIMKTPGAGEAANAIRQSLKGSAARLAKVSEVLKTASAAGLRRTRHHANPLQVGGTDDFSPLGPSGCEATPSGPGSLLSPQGEVVVISGGGAIALILVIVAFKYLEYQVEERVIGGALERCLQNAEEAYLKCLASSKGNPFVIMGCTAICVATKAACYAGIG